MIRTIGDGGINWNWYWNIDFNDTDKTCHIYYHERWHKYENRGSNHPIAEWGNHRIQALEDDKRIVYGIKFNGIEYLVTNPQQIFSYNDMTHYKPE